MKIIRLILLILLLLVVVVVVGGFLVYNDTMRGPLPQTSGSLNVNGLDAQVEILRDDWGIPHIYASTSHDLFFAQGYVQAQDRWWQMEFFRHTGSGSIEELTGKTSKLIGTDIFIRTVGWRRTADQEAANMSDAERSIAASVRRWRQCLYPQPPCQRSGDAVSADRLLQASIFRSSPGQSRTRWSGQK